MWGEDYPTSAGRCQSQETRLDGPWVWCSLAILVFLCTLNDSVLISLSKHTFISGTHRLLFAFFPFHCHSLGAKTTTKSIITMKLNCRLFTQHHYVCQAPILIWGVSEGNTLLTSHWSSICPRKHAFNRLFIACCYSYDWLIKNVPFVAAFEVGKFAPSASKFGMQQLSFYQGKKRGSWNSRASLWTNSAKNAWSAAAWPLVVLGKKGSAKVQGERKGSRNAEHVSAASWAQGNANGFCALLLGKEALD